MILWFVGCKNRVHKKPIFDGVYIPLLLREKVKSSIMSKCHRVIRYLKNHKIVEMDEKGIGENARWFLNCDYIETRGKSSHYFENTD